GAIPASLSGDARVALAHRPGRAASAKAAEGHPAGAGYAGNLLPGGTQAARGAALVCGAAGRTAHGAGRAQVGALSPARLAEPQARAERLPRQGRAPSAAQAGVAAS